MAFFVPTSAVRTALAILAMGVAVLASSSASAVAEATSGWVRNEAADIRLVSAVSGTAGR